MKLLIYGFESFGQDSTNVSQEVVNRLPIRQNMAKMILPVRFNASIILSNVKEYKPDYILGLGQYPDGDKIRIEKLAVNEWASGTNPSRTIVDGGPESATVMLDLEPDDNSLVSHDAGRYFCNYSMYILLTNPKTKDIPFAFLHIPKNFDLKESVEFVENKVEKILT